MLSGFEQQLRRYGRSYLSTSLKHLSFVIPFRLCSSNIFFSATFIGGRGQCISGQHTRAANISVALAESNDLTKLQEILSLSTLRSLNSVWECLNNLSADGLVRNESVLVFRQNFTSWRRSKGCNDCLRSYLTRYKRKYNDERENGRSPSFNPKDLPLPLSLKRTSRQSNISW